jgi:hypothetical protein
MFILFLLWLINRIATVALVLTGLSMDAASFQVRSALLGIGFTTNESELIVQHPVRRQIFLLLMLAGNTGIVTAMVSLIIGFMDMDHSTSLWARLAVIVGCLIPFYFIARSRWIAFHLSRAITWALKRFTVIEVRDYEYLMQLSEGYGISEMKVREDEWMAGRLLGELELTKEGILVLGIYRDHGDFIGAPKAQTVIKAGDTLIVYGLTTMVDELDSRPKGHKGAVKHFKAEKKYEALTEDKSQ